MIIRILLEKAIQIVQFIVEVCEHDGAYINLLKIIIHEYHPFQTSFQSINTLHLFYSTVRMQNINHFMRLLLFSLVIICHIDQTFSSDGHKDIILQSIS